MGRFPEKHSELLDYVNAGTIKGLNWYISNHDTISDGNTVEFGFSGIETPPLISIKLYASNEATMTLYEGADFSGGTTLTSRNRNRNKSDGNSMDVVRDPTVSSNGTDIGADAGGASGILGFEFANKDVKALVFEKNTDYLLSITSNSNENIISWLFEWTEDVY